MTVKEERIVFETGIEAEIWRIEDCRKRTLERINDLPEESLEWHTDNYPNSISTLLYHIAAIEADWLFVEVIGKGFEKVETLFPYDVRDENRRLTVIKNMTLAEHLERLNTVRQYLLETYNTMTEAQFRQKREMPRYFVTPEWVIHHLRQHEAEHRGEIGVLYSLYQANSKSE